ncbi:hypothetical protein [Actinosynnema sp. NPDC023587]|uniref:hypothetical protein n=1 Tax=Actinosynnema sp. NPDC023587 TaxID=3154695 RepID=UPI0034118B4F
MTRLRFLAHAAAAATMAAGLLTVAFTGTANACSCMPGDTEATRYARASQVFTGVVLSQKLEPNKPDTPNDDQYRYTLRVTKEYKQGDLPRRVDVFTATNGAMCGIRLTRGVEYLVFAHNATYATLGTHLCSGTRLASGGPPNTSLPLPPTSSTSVWPTTSGATSAP